MKNYSLLIGEDVKPGDLIRIDKVRGSRLDATLINTSKPSIRLGPKWKKKERKDKP